MPFTPDNQIGTNKNPKASVLGKSSFIADAVQQATKQPMSLKEKAQNVSTGIAKYGIESSVGTARLLQSAGKKVLGAFGADTSKMGFKSLEGEDAQQIDSQLESKNNYEKAGKVIGFGAELLNPIGKTTEIKSAVTKGKDVIKNVVNEIGEKKSKKALEEIAELTAEPLNKQGRTDLLALTGKQTKTGKMLGAEKKGFLGTVKPIATEFDLKRAETVKDLVSKDPLESIGNLNKAASDISEGVIRPNLQANPRAFNLQTINSRLASKEMPTVFRADSALEKTYDLVRQKMVEEIKKYPKTMEGLWDARINFDQSVKREFGNLAFEDPKRSAVRLAIQDMRREVNNFIADEIGDDVFKESMQDLHYLYDSAENIAENNNKIFGTNKFQRWAKDHPNLVGAFKWGSLGAGGAITLDSLFN